MQQPLPQSLAAAAGEFPAPAQEFAGLGDQQRSGGEGTPPVGLQARHLAATGEESADQILAPGTRADQFRQRAGALGKRRGRRRPTWPGEGRAAVLPTEKGGGGDGGFVIGGDQRLQTLAQNRFQGRF